MEDVNNPTKKEDCYERPTSLTENVCCYMDAEVTLLGVKSTIIRCTEIELGSDLEKQIKEAIEQIESMGGKVDHFDVYCSSHEKEDTSQEDTTKPNSSSSYLKIGFLFILCFIL